MSRPSICISLLVCWNIGLTPSPTSGVQLQKIGTNLYPHQKLSETWTRYYHPLHELKDIQTNLRALYQKAQQAFLNHAPFQQVALTGSVSLREYLVLIEFRKHPSEKVIRAIKSSCPGVDVMIQTGKVDPKLQTQTDTSSN